MRKQYTHLSVAKMDIELLSRLETQFVVKLDKDEYVDVYETEKNFIVGELVDRVEYNRTAYLINDNKLVETMFEVLVQSDKLVKELALKLVERVNQETSYSKVYIDEPTGKVIKFYCSNFRKKLIF